MESPPQNPEFRNNPENFPPCVCTCQLVSYAGYHLNFVSYAGYHLNFVPYAGYHLNFVSQ